VSLREESDEVTCVRSALPCVRAGARSRCKPTQRQLEKSLRERTTCVYLPGHGPQIRFRIPTTKCSLDVVEPREKNEQSFAVSWKASLQVARLCEAQAIISPRLHRDGPPGYSVGR
jgi:hypothetical protein